MRLATSTLTLLLCIGLPGTALLSAQDIKVNDNPQGQETPDNPDRSQSGEAGDATGQGLDPAQASDVHAPAMHGLTVQVMQDPIRIAPGEQGHLVLLVRLPKGRTVEKGGQVVMEAKQGPLNLGTAVWDPPARGKNDYKDVLVIKVPLSMDAKAPYGKHPFQGSLRLRGDFHSMREDIPEVVAAGGADDPSASKRANSRIFDPNRAEVPFQHAVNVGPPMPKASRNQRKNGAPISTAGTGSTVDPAGGSTKNPAAAMPADGVPGRGTGSTQRTASGSGAPLTVAGAEEAPELAEEDEGAIPWWMLSVALVVLAALSFVIQARKG